MSAKEYLEAKGIVMENTTLISFIDGAMRQPDLISLMEEYAKLKIQEMDYKASEGLFPSEEAI